MNKNLTGNKLRISGLGLLATLTLVWAQAQGMPAEARKNIHALFDSHDTLTRTLEITPSGYTALTESSNPEVAQALKAHVKQMSKRLESGLRVRRWDPAFEEYVAFYGDIEHRFEPTDKGIRAVVKGKTPDAIRVAQNHAHVIMDFADHGWEAHDRRHPAVSSQSQSFGLGPGRGRGRGHGGPPWATDPKPANEPSDAGQCSVCGSEPQADSNGGCRQCPRCQAAGSCPTGNTTDLETRAIDRGQAITREAFQVLSSNLLQALTSGGVKAALPYCSAQAAPLTEGVAQKNEVQLLRVSHKARNPKNQADLEEMKLLLQFRAELSKEKKPQPIAVTNPDRTVTYYAPIIIDRPVCLRCHGRPGQELTENAVSLIKDLYPDDKAIGFSLGDLRGMWRIDFSSDALATDSPH